MVLVLALALVFVHHLTTTRHQNPHHCRILPRDP